MLINNCNPITKLDYPDPDVIRVGDVYYMVSTTMHFMPGCEILLSYDLANWEHLTYVYEKLDSTPGQRLTGEENIYGKGMWAATIRYHRGYFYICFVANDTGKTYLYISNDILGPWEKKQIEGFYHDVSLLFDEDERVYIAYGNKDIYLTELDSDLSGPKEGGLHRLLVSDEGNERLGYEGTHFYKIKGRYYLFFIHSLKERWRRVESCFSSDSLLGEFTGRDVLDDDMGYGDQGVAQGGIVDTPDGKWFAILFQDRGAVGRIPVLVPVTWESEFPIFGVDGKVPENIEIISTRPEYQYQQLVGSDDFKGEHLRNSWQFNHEPDLSLTELKSDEGAWCVKTDKICKNLSQAKNTLTQRMIFPECTGEVTVDASELNEGDYAGICALQGCYGMVAVTKREGKNYIVMQNREAVDDSLMGMPKDTEPGCEREVVPLEGSSARLRVRVSFGAQGDFAEFFYYDGLQWIQIGVTHKLFFKLDHFVGCRFGLFMYSTIKSGRNAGFLDFYYHIW